MQPFKKYKKNPFNIISAIKLPFQFVLVLFRGGLSEAKAFVLGKQRSFLKDARPFMMILKARILRVRPVIVFQMGKVGSRTVQESVIRAYEERSIGVPVYHPHIMTNLDIIAERLQEERAQPRGLGSIERSRELVRRMKEEPRQKWNIITLVRDPIARNVGAFFQNFVQFVPDWQERYAKGDLGIEEIQNVFINARSIHNAPIVWFDEQLKPLFGVDVFASPFPTEAGYKIYEDNPRYRVLLIRLEDLNRVATQAMKEFLGLNDFQLVNTNIGEDKYYAEAYREFKNHPLPEEYVQQTYSIKLAKHFYTPEELSGFASRWRKVK